MYAFGFLFMLPQLFVNYKVRRVPRGGGLGALCGLLLTRTLSPPQMKSVAHLPWKAFTYKVSALPVGAVQCRGRVSVTCWGVGVAPTAPCGSGCPEGRVSMSWPVRSHHLLIFCSPWSL